MVVSLQSPSVRPKPFVVQGFPKNCGPSKSHTATHSPVKCTPVIESSPESFPEESGPLASGTNGGRTEGFMNMGKPKILYDIAGEMGGEDEQKLGPLDAVWETAVESVAEIIALAREFIAVLDGECSTSKNLIDISVFAEQKSLMEAVKTVEGGVLSNILFKGVDGQYFGEKVSEIGEVGGVDMTLKRFQ